MEKPFYLTTVGADNLELGLFRYSLTPEQKFIATNNTLISMLGYSSKRDLFQQQFESFFVQAKDKHIFFEMLRRNATVKHFEVPFVKKDGEVLWVAVTASCIFTHEGNKCLEGIVQDITYQRELQERITMENDFLQALFDNIPDAVYFKDKHNRIVKVNKFYVEGTGLKEEEIIGKCDFDFFPFEQAKSMFDDDNHVLATGHPIIGKIEKTLLPNGNWNQVITTKVPLYDKKGRIIGTMGTTRDMTEYASYEKKRLSMAISALEVLGKALEMRDPYTFSHMRNVACIAEAIGRALGWNENRLLGIKLAGELHDLGKISIPLDILNKPGKLSTLEYCLIQEHISNCYNLIKDIDFPFPLADIICQHHERLDGSGYPRQLQGDQILLESRILAVSDVFEAMTHHRPYRAAVGLQKACDEITAGKGVKYDAIAVEVLLDLVRKNPEKEFWLNS